MEIKEQTVQLLDQNTANQIAAGEVVEKPASVVKELVENALDAGADVIEVSIFEGGTEYIRVVDNGCGMSEANARLAVLRHATSKLRRAEDLMSLATLGFRGEALPSIASVSKFTLLTRPENAEYATSIRIEGGETLEVTQAGGSAGTTIIVEDLFYNVPARRKFLKTALTEGRYIRELLEKLALSRPDVCFKLKNNDKEVLHTPGDGDLRMAIRSVYGKAVAQELLYVAFRDPKVKISGFISKPTLLKGTRQWQTLFVNGRMIGNKMLAKAIDHAYQSQIPKNGFPYAILNIEVDTHTIDVNVHPQKSEIKFSDDSTMYKAMFKALSDTLSRPMSAVPQQVSLLPDSELNVFQEPSLAQATATRAAVDALGGTAQPAAKTTGKYTEPVPSFTNKLGEPEPEIRISGEPFRQLFRSDAGAIFRNPEEEQEPLFTGEHKEAAKPYPVVECSRGVAEPTQTGFAVAQSADGASEEVAQTRLFAADEATEKATIFADTAPKSTAGSEKAEQSEKVFGASFKDGLGYSNANPVSNNIIQSAPSEPQTFCFTNTEARPATVWPIGQVDKTFIIAQAEDTLYIIDQHAAHERILFDKLTASHTDIPSQQLLIPMYINLDEDEIAELEEHHEEFVRLGVDVSQAGETTLRISSLPADLAAEDAEDFIREIAKLLREQRQLDGSTLRQEILHTTACKAAIKAGQILNMRQMRQLLVDLFNTEHPFTCPHGRPCMIEFDSSKLYKLFKRTGF